MGYGQKKIAKNIWHGPLIIAWLIGAHNMSIVAHNMWRIAEVKIWQKQIACDQKVFFVTFSLKWRFSTEEKTFTTFSNPWVISGTTHVLTSQTGHLLAMLKEGLMLSMYGLKAFVKLKLTALELKQPMQLACYPSKCFVFVFWLIRKSAVWQIFINLTRWSFDIFKISVARSFPWTLHFWLNNSSG